MKRIHRLLVFLVLIILPAIPLSAGAGFPTFDLTGYLQEILGYTQDGQQIANEIKNWENELKRWQQLYKAFEDGDLENILGGINGAVGRLDNTLGRYNVSVGWLDGVSDLSTSLTDTGFDVAKKKRPLRITAAGCCQSLQQVSCLPNDGMPGMGFAISHLSQEGGGREQQGTLFVRPGDNPGSACKRAAERDPDPLYIRQCAVIGSGFAGRRG